MNSLILVLSGLIVGQADTLDAFEYRNDAEAREAWTSSEGTPPVRAYDGRVGRALRVEAPFAADVKMKRAVIDREVKLNLSAPTSFTLDVNHAHADLIDHVTLYFHSQDGWFSGSARSDGAGWRTLRFDKSAFGIEDQPVGWHSIDRIRIALWKTTSDDAVSRDTAVLLRRLTATWNNTAIVVPDSAEVEWKASHDAADTLEKMLVELGVGVDRLTESDLPHGSLGQRKLVLLPYNRPNDEVCDALVRFVERGGKIFLGYAVPRQLQETLGFRDGAYYKPASDQAKLATIRFDADDIAGLPRSVNQTSWNISTVEGAGHGARVIAWWHDEDGNRTDKGAMWLSDRAAYLSHIVLRDDWDEKKAMLAAVLGKLQPAVWNEIVESAMVRAEHVGHCQSGKELAAAIQDQLSDEGRRTLHDADQLREKASRLLVAGLGYEASEAIRRCRELRVGAYLKSQPSPSREGRAFWEHSGTGAYPGDWDRTCRELAEAGFNMIIPNMLWAGAAHYPSDVLPRSKTFQKYGDQIEQCLAAAKKHGLEVHVWKVNHNPGHHTPREFIERMRKAGRTQVDINGEVTDWLNPAHPDNFKLEVDSMLEVVRKYDVDGIHFDYIRYPNNNLDFSDFSRRKFESDTGLTVKNWPRDCHSGPLHDAYRDWRADQITRLVETVSREARKIRPGVKISAAVFRDYPSCRASVGQDWPLWAKRGYVDFLCPMNYTADDKQFAAWIKTQSKLVGNVPLYPGIGATASRVTLTADRVVGQIHIARELGADGFTVFNLTEQTAKTILPGIRSGAGRAPATPSHRKSD